MEFICKVVYNGRNRFCFKVVPRWRMNMSLKKKIAAAAVVICIFSLISIWGQSVLSEDSAVKEARKILSTMTLDKKIAQMIMPSISVRGKKPEDASPPLTKADDEVKNAIRSYGFGGVILFTMNTQGTQQTTLLIHDMQEASEIPLLIGIDQEGGNVVRLKTACWMPGNMLLGATGNSEYAKKAAEIIGEEMNCVGVNVNFAPCADVNCNPKNPIIGLRSFSSSPDDAAKMVGASVEGYHNAGMAVSLKHFPGHGDTEVDSHLGLSKIDRTYEELMQMELPPFKAGIDAGADMIMTAHIQFPKIETETYRSITLDRDIALPATLSKTMITDVLRSRLGFKGVVTTDAMDMGAIDKHFKAVDAARLAINAGVDILLMPGDISTEQQIEKLASYMKSIRNLVEAGEISEETIDASVLRILTLKVRRGIIGTQEKLHHRLARAKHNVGSPKHHKEEWKITQAGITVLKNEDATLPVIPGEDCKVCIVYPYASEATTVQYAVGAVLRDGTIKSTRSISLVSYNEVPFEQIRTTLESCDVAIVISELLRPSQFKFFKDDDSRFSTVRKIIEFQHSHGGRAVVISATLPYDIAAYKDADALMIAYGALEMAKAPAGYFGETEGYGPNIPAAVAMCLGQAEPNGKLPVDIPALNESYEYTDEILYSRGSGLTGF